MKKIRQPIFNSRNLPYMILFLLLGTVMGTSVVSEMSSDSIWFLRGDGTVVLNNSDNNVNIGENESTTYKLKVNGTTFLNDTLEVSGNILPDSSSNFNLGNPGLCWSHLFVNNITSCADDLNINSDTIINGNLTVTNNINIDNLSLDNISVNNITEFTPGYGIHLINDTYVSTDLDVGDRLDVGGDIVVVDDVFCDVAYTRTVGINSSVYHRGDPDTYMHYNNNEIYFVAEGNKTLQITSYLVEIWRNLTVHGNITADENITAKYFIGNGSGLWGINASNITGNVSLENISVNNISEYNDYGIHFLNNVNMIENFTVNGNTTLCKTNISNCSNSAPALWVNESLRISDTYATQSADTAFMINRDYITGAYIGGQLSGRMDQLQGLRIENVLQIDNTDWDGLWEYYALELLSDWKWGNHDFAKIVSFNSHMSNMASEGNVTDVISFWIHDSSTKGRMDSYTGILFENFITSRVGNYTGLQINPTLFDVGNYTGINISDCPVGTHSDSFAIKTGTGNVSFGDNVTVEGNVLPFVNNTYNLGSNTRYWNDLYVSGTAHLANITINASNILTENLSVNNISEYNNYGIHFLDDVNITENLTVLETIIGQKFMSLHANNTHGTDSVALNFNTSAYGNYATSIGYSSNASGMYSFAGNRESIASGISSFAFGRDAYATTANCIAMHYEAEATAPNAMAFGDRAKAHGSNSLALGVYHPTVWGSHSVVSGVYINLTANYSQLYGVGVGFHNRLRNPIDYSWAVGINSTKPTLFLDDAHGIGNLSNFGIGTSNPHCRLTVNGSVCISGNLTVNGTSFLDNVTINASDIATENLSVNNISEYTPGYGIHLRNDATISGDLAVDNDITALTLDTGQGANELYDMNQNVLTTSDVTFNDATVNAELKVVGAAPYMIFDDTGIEGDTTLKAGRPFLPPTITLPDTTCTLPGLSLTNTWTGFSNTFNNPIYVATDIIHRLDTDTKISFETNTIIHKAKNLEMAKFYYDSLTAQNKIIFNGGGVDIDTVMESADDVSMFFLNAFTNKLGLSDSSPAALLDVGGGTATYIDGTDDLLVKDDLEVDGDAYLEGDLTVDGTSYLGNVVIDADNISFNNATESTTDYGIHLRNDTTVHENLTVDHTIGIGTDASSSINVKISIDDLTGFNQYGMSITGVVTESTNFYGLQCIPTFAPSANGKIFYGINLGAVIAGSNDIVAVRGFYSPIISSSYTGTISNLNVFESAPVWFAGSSTINNVRGFYYNPTRFAGTWNNQIGLHINKLDEATNNCHVLLGDTQPAGDWSIYSSNGYPSYFDDDVNITGVTNSTGGFATSVGPGLTFTFTCTEGTVTVTNGIITGKSW